MTRGAAIREGWHVFGADRYLAAVLAAAGGAAIGAAWALVSR